MKILQIHNRYKQAGGEWTVVNQEQKLLSEKHTVHSYFAENSKEINGLADRLKLLFSTHYNSESKRRVQEKLTGSNYDLMHVHNFFPVLSPSIFEAAREQNVPSVMSLHNFRLIHPNGLMFHNGEPDHRSVKGSAYRCVPDGVYRNSMIQTAVVAHMIEYHRKKKTWESIPSAFIALSEFSRNLFIEGGLPADRIFIKPNFIEDPVQNKNSLFLNSKKENTFLYVGRISEEKGVQQLVECWLRFKPDARLVIAGDGPLKAGLEEKSRRAENIEWLGQISRDQILQLLSVAKALLFPTKCYEGQPLILLEAMSMGCPVITSKIGNPENMIDDGETGFHFKPGDIDDMYDKCRIISKNPSQSLEMGKRARSVYLEKYTPQKNLELLTEIYEKAAELEKKLSPHSALYE
jgi:glycosyltransferase involved in cell wall biosynthesis